MPPTPTPPMDPAIKEQWLHALRSGEYTQGTRVLHTFIKHGGDQLPTSEYCCLGVLCDLAVKAGVVAERKAFGRDFCTEYYEEDAFHMDLNEARSDILPNVVARWAGLRDQCPTLSLTDDEYSPQTSFSRREGVKLSHLNDAASWNFLQIADMVEKYL